MVYYIQQEKETIGSPPKRTERKYDIMTTTNSLLFMMKPISMDVQPSKFAVRRQQENIVMDYLSSATFSLRCCNIADLIEDSNIEFPKYTGGYYTKRDSLTRAISHTLQRLEDSGQIVSIFAHNRRYYSIPTLGNNN